LFGDWHFRGQVGGVGLEALSAIQSTHESSIVLGQTATPASIERFQTAEGSLWVNGVSRSSAFPAIPAFHSEPEVSLTSALYL